MQDLTFQICESSTTSGSLHFIASTDFQNSNRHVVIMLHGALRCCDSLAGWLPVLSRDYDMILVDLPGHGRDRAIGNPSLSDYAVRLQDFISVIDERRKVAVLGESLGGLVALGLGQGTTPRVAAVMAADPPLSTAKQWCVRLNVQRPAIPMTPYQRALLTNMMGFDGDKILKDHLYYPLIEKVRVPTLVITGDTPLFPALPDVKDIPKHVPCLIDEVDKAFIRQIGNPLVSVEIIRDAGHLCMDAANRQACHIVRAFCSQHLPPVAV
ncbi:alpha/beta fold hydrolase [Hyphomicrobium sp.]|uniref:alpha/beta fold hydrolase n=1 Tax=Hyphomicrobium sp. TaxID=82 RepID=UPI002E37BBF4|nr:alpha/beta fold hydrolase [Hyphomicrobium sp.]HEX2842496.1 alpha/beta fold hydrolase [Hyphomicrobium sp.]